MLVFACFLLLLYTEFIEPLVPIASALPSETSLRPAGEVVHEIWDELLRQHVDAEGKVNYAGFKADKKRLQAYLDLLAANPIQTPWSRAEKMTYLINAYNAFTVKLIVDNYPLTSIRDLHGGEPWDVQWIRLGDRTYSLNELEHDILRPQFQDPRIHFAVNCAARSCPPLLNRAYTADQLDRQLDRQARAFINNLAYNKLSEKEVEISKIFEWYQIDFGKLIDYLNRYAEIDIAPDARIRFREYDWALNNKS